MHIWPRVVGPSPPTRSWYMELPLAPPPPAVVEGALYLYRIV